MSVRNAADESVDQGNVKIPDIPNTPAIGTVVDVGTSRAYNNGAATVPFTPDTSYWGDAITSYTATSSPGGFTGTSATSPITVAGLQSGTGYSFTVTANTATSSSAATSASNSITATTIPQAPTIGTATDLGTGGAVSVTFTPGASGGKTVTAYTATSSPGSITGTNTSSPITVSGLANGTAYTFTVTATNANGVSSASSASSSVTPTLLGFQSISTTTVGSGGTSTVIFSSIPATYTHLQIRGIARGNIGLAGDRYIELTFNSDGTTAYNRHELYNTASSPSATGSATVSSIYSAHYPSSGDTASIFGSFIIDILDYTNTNKYTTVRSLSGWDANGSGGIYLSSGAWRNTSAVTSITLAGSANFAQYSSFALYGIKVA